MRKYYLFTSILIIVMIQLNTAAFADDHQLFNAQSITAVQNQQAVSIEQGIRQGRITRRKLKSLKSSSKPFWQ